MKPDPWDALRPGRLRDICRGQDDAGNAVRPPAGHTRSMYLAALVDQGRLPPEAVAERPAARTAPRVVLAAPESARAAPSLPCLHRGEQLRTIRCRPCERQPGQPPDVPVFACALHRECTLMKTGTRLRGCSACPDRTPMTAAIVILSHNYGRFLSEAIESALANRPTEVVVVDDASDDDTPAVAARFADCGVRYLRIEARNTHAGRAAGFAATTAEVLCFLDADDVLPADYLSDGLPHFEDSAVGVVYSDFEEFGARSGRRIFKAMEPHIEQANFAHAGSLVRREALTQAGCFDRSIPCDTSNDWYLWRALYRLGWRFGKSSAVYRYRRHADSQSYRMRESRERSYFLFANLAQEDVTLFIPLAGRAPFWPRLVSWLESQTWPRKQTRLVLCDTSQDDGFHATVRAWVERSGLPDVRLYRQAVGPPLLADANRREKFNQRAVAEAMPRIYNRAVRECSTEWLMIVEDDVLPPRDAIERLLRGMDRDVASVSGAYRSRFHPAYVAWRDGRHLRGGQGLEPVEGNGFGCLLLRKSVAQQHVFHSGPPRHHYDPNFYRWLRDAQFPAWRGGTTRFRALLDWSVECQHG